MSYSYCLNSIQLKQEVARKNPESRDLGFLLR